MIRMTVQNIENITYEDAKKLETDHVIIKGHECIFVDFKNSRFGYSVLVFMNKRHIYYADEYGINHAAIHNESGNEGLRAYYIELLNKRLFTKKEMLGPVISYEDYEAKDHFLRNYWIQRYQCMPIFNVYKNTEPEHEAKELPFYNPISFCFVESKSIVKMAKKYSNHLERGFEKLKSNNVQFRHMVRTELERHEAGITGTHIDALDALKIRYEDLSRIQVYIVDRELEKLMNRKACG
jgi:hypothetical protein